MAWTSPRTWTSEVLTSALLNTHLRDNLNYLFAPNTDNAHDTGVETTTSTTFVDADATNLSIDVAPAGTEVFLIFIAMVSHDTTNGRIYFDITQDGSSITSLTSGLGGVTPGATTAESNICLIHRRTGLTPNQSYNFKLRWRTNAGTATMANNTAYCDFIAREIT